MNLLPAISHAISTFVAILAVIAVLGTVPVFLGVKRG